MVAAMSASLRTSAAKGSMSIAPYSSRAMRQVSSAASSERSTARIRAPSCAKRKTVARPLPTPEPGLWPAPMTTATLSLSLIPSFLVMGVVGGVRRASTDFCARPCFHVADQRREVFVCAALRDGVFPQLAGVLAHPHRYVQRLGLAQAQRNVLVY